MMMVKAALLKQLKIIISYRRTHEVTSQAPKKNSHPPSHLFNVLRRTHEVTSYHLFNGLPADTPGLLGNLGTSPPGECPAKMPF